MDRQNMNDILQDITTAMYNLNIILPYDIHPKLHYHKITYITNMHSCTSTLAVAVFSPEAVEIVGPLDDFSSRAFFDYSDPEFIDLFQEKLLKVVQLNFDKYFNKKLNRQLQERQLKETYFDLKQITIDN